MKHGRCKKAKCRHHRKRWNDVPTLYGFGELHLWPWVFVLNLQEPETSTKTLTILWWLELRWLGTASLWWHPLYHSRAQTLPLQTALVHVWQSGWGNGHFIRYVVANNVLFTQTISKKKKQQLVNNLKSYLSRSFVEPFYCRYLKEMQYFDYKLEPMLYKNPSPPKNRANRCLAFSEPNYLKK